MAILGREAAQNIGNINDCGMRARHQVAAAHCDGRQVRRATLQEPLAASPGDVDRSLTAHRATLLQESLKEIERPGCALGGEYFLCKDIGMIANSLSLLKFVYIISQPPAHCIK